MEMGNIILESIRIFAIQAFKQVTVNNISGATAPSE